MESICRKSDSKCNLDAATDKSQTHCERKIPVVRSSSSRFQTPNVIHNRKRPKSFPFSSKCDFLTPTERTNSLSRLVSQFETAIDNSKNVDNSQINIPIHRDKVMMNIMIPLPGLVSKESELCISTDLHSATFVETKLRSCKLAACHRGEETTPAISINKNENLLTPPPNPANTTPDEEVGVKIKSQIFPLDNKKNVRIVPEHHYEEIDELDCQNTIKCSEFKDSNRRLSEYEEPIQKFDEKRTFSSEDAELVSPVNQRWQGNTGKFGSLDNEKSKAETGDYNTENDDDELWKNYTERPLLPLKPLQKQRSKSCVNLVQTLKGLSKKKSSSNTRNSSPMNNIKNLLFPENALTQKKEMYISEANISEIRTELVTSTDVTVRKMNDTEFAAKNTRQSLLPNYTWFHPVDAKEASKRLLKMRQNGAFLIRPASNPTSEVLHTLCVVFSRKVYNFHVKNLEDGRITLGKRKGQEETFPSLLDMIKYHQFVPISINSSESNQVSHVYLLITPPK